MTVALVHDYLTQRGGAERVVLSLMNAFPEAPLYTSLYDDAGTFPAFRGRDIRRLALDRVPLLRGHHRLALPILAPAFSRLDVNADVVVCSSSGWAHGVRTTGRKVVYCHAPARWLYQGPRYLGARPQPVARGALALLRPALARWDRRAAASASRYLVNSTAVRDSVRAEYGVDAEVVAPPHSLDPEGRQTPVAGLDDGFVLCVSRLLPYKNVSAVVQAFADLPGERLVLVGTGPDEVRLRRTSTTNVHVLGATDDAQLRWLYAHARGIVAASYEDYGLTPLEAASFGRPAAVLRWGGFRDTVLDGETGLFFDRPEPEEIRAAVRLLLAREWDAERLRRHASAYSQERFAARIREIVAEEAGR